MNLLNSFSNFRNKTNIIVASQASSNWSVLDTGLSSSYKIGRPTKYVNSYNYHFAVTGGSEKILRYNIDTGLFSSSSASISQSSLTDTIRSYTTLTNSTPDGNIYANIRRTHTVSPLTFAASLIRGTNGYLYNTNVAAAYATFPSGGDADAIKWNINEFDGILTVNHSDGYFTYVKSSTGLADFGGNLEAVTFFVFDCSDSIYDGTNFILVGGSGSTAKIYRQAKSSYTASSSWSSISSSFGQGISKIGLAQVYLNYSKVQWLPPEYYYVTQSSYTKILLIGGLNGRIARSTDSGATWSNSSTQPFLTTDRVTGFASTNIAIFAVTDTGKVAKSMDAGVNWTLIDIGASPSNLDFAQSVISPDGQHKIYIGGNNAFLANWTYEPISITVT